MSKDEMDFEDAMSIVAVALGAGWVGLQVVVGFAIVLGIIVAIM